MLLHTAIKILIDKELYRGYNSYAYDLLLLFVQRAKVLYGVQFVSYNVHGVLHLPSDALRNGPLDTFSLFEFENLLQDVKNMLRKHELPLQQIIRRLVEKERNVLIPTEKEEKAMFLTFKHISGPVIDAQQECVQFKLMNYQGWAFKTNNVSDCWAMLSDGKLVKVLNIVQSVLDTSIVGNFFNPRLTTSLYETPPRFFLSRHLFCQNPIFSPLLAG